MSSILPRPRLPGKSRTAELAFTKRGIFIGRMLVAGRQLRAFNWTGDTLEALSRPLDVSADALLTHCHWPASAESASAEFSWRIAVGPASSKARAQARMIAGLTRSKGTCREQNENETGNVWPISPDTRLYIGLQS
eukprot:4884790-Pyramimonas_sp.AAC.1